MFGQHLARKEHFVAASGNRLADDLFRPSAGIHFSGVDKSETAVQPGAQRCDFTCACSTAFSHVPRALAQGGDAVA